MKIIFIYGMLEVLDYFNEQMRIGAEELGHETYIVNAKDPSTHTGEPFDSFTKSENTFVFGFNQIGMLLKDGNDSYWDKYRIPFVDFIQDHPWNYYDALDAPIEQLYPIVLDRNHGVFIEKYFPWIHKPYFMVNGGTPEDNCLPYNERDIDILYVGTCNVEPPGYPLISTLPDQGRGMYEYVIGKLLAEPDHTIESIIEEYCENGDFEITLQDVKDIIGNYAPYVMEKVRREYKLATMDALAKTGARIEIYGDNWEDSRYPWGENVHIHKRVSSAECNLMMGRSKIGLNCMPWYKRGCSERVFNIMQNGALCLTDYSEYIGERFVHGENILIYNLTNLSELTNMVSNMLSNPEKAASMAKKGQEIVREKDTWKCRMAEVIGYVENNIFRAKQ